MATLRRTEAGGFSIAHCVTLEELEAMEIEDRVKRLRPVEELFSDLEALNLPDFYRTLCRNGCEIYLKKLGVSFPVGARLSLLRSGRGGGIRGRYRRQGHQDFCFVRENRNFP